MRVVWGLDRQISDYVGAQFPIVVERGGYDFYRAVGFADDEGRIFGGLVLSEYRGHDADLSVYAERPEFINRRVLREFFHWAFVEEGFIRLSAKIAKSNKPSRRLAVGLGFRLEGTQRYGFDNGEDDQCLYGMTFDSCFWLKRQDSAKNRPRKVVVDALNSSTTLHKSDAGRCYRTSKERKNHGVQP